MDIAASRTLYSVLAIRAAAQPDELLLLYEDPEGQIHRWSAAQLLESVHQAAHLLLELGLGPGSVFSLHLDNHPAYPQLILAASLLGAVAVPSNPASTADELGYLVDHAGSRAIFTTGRGLEIACQIAGECPVVLCGGAQLSEDFHYEIFHYEAKLETQPLSAPPGEGVSERLVQLLYTSGTTARPKGVMLTNAALVYAAEVFCAGSGLRPEDRHLLTLPLFHAGAQCHALWPALVGGASVALMPRFSASRFFVQALAHQCTLAALFGAPLRMLLNQPDRPEDRAHRLRNVTFAQNLTPSQYEEWQRRFGAPLQQLWGMTETCGLPLMSPRIGSRRLQAMGRPVLGYEVAIVDAQDRDVAVRTPGQLIVRGDPGSTLMQGYLDNEAATAATLRQRDGATWLYSGDTAYADEEGFVYFVDRGKDLIKRAGENISSIAIEAVLLECEGVLEACVVGVPDVMRDELIAAAVVLAPGAKITAAALLGHCARHLAAFKVPDRVEFVEQLPRTSVGKVQKQVVRTWLADLGSVDDITRD